MQSALFHQRTAETTPAWPGCSLHPQRCSVGCCHHSADTHFAAACCSAPPGSLLAPQEHFHLHVHHGLIRYYRSEKNHRVVYSKDKKKFLYFLCYFHLLVPGLYSSVFACLMEDFFTADKLFHLYHDQNKSVRLCYFTVAFKLG